MSRPLSLLRHFRRTFGKRESDILEPMGAAEAQTAVIRTEERRPLGPPARLDDREWLHGTPIP